MFLSPFVLRTIYFAKFNLLLRYGIFFWGGESNIINIRRIQIRVHRIIRGVDKRESGRQIFKDCKILTVTSLFILEVLWLISYCKAVKYGIVFFGQFFTFI